MRLQLTVAILKPDILARPRAAEAARERIVASGLLILRSRVMQWTLDDAHTFYKQHRGKFFFDRLANSMISGPLNALVLAGEGAISRWRQLIGPTKIAVARLHYPHSLRGQFGLTDTRNSFHGADSESDVLQELKLLFPDFEPTVWQDNEERALQNGMFHYDQKLGIHIPPKMSTS